MALSDQQRRNTLKPKRVVFEKAGSRSLKNLPSHEGGRHGPVRPGRRLRKKQGVGRIIGGLAAVLMALFALVVGAVQLGAFDEALASRANEILKDAVPEPFSVATQNTSVGFSWPPSLGVRYEGFRIADSTNMTVIASAESLSVNLDVIKSTFGTPVFSSLSVDGAMVDLPELQKLLADGPMGQISLQDVPKWHDAIGNILDTAFDAGEDAKSPLRLVIRDSQIAIVPNAYSDTVAIQSAQARLYRSELNLEASIVLAEQPVNVSGRSERNQENAVLVTLEAEDIVFPVKRLR
ncbi:MAG: hypothetical protein AAFR27_08690, partial [Pseudomonadota bacterium]